MIQMPRALQGVQYVCGGVCRGRGSERYVRESRAGVKDGQDEPYKEILAQWAKG